jgi:hypothetical protein
VYICDRFVVPRLSDAQQAEIGDGVLSLDVLTRQYIRDHFEYRYVILRNGKDALALDPVGHRRAPACRGPSCEAHGPPRRRAARTLDRLP